MDRMENIKNRIKENFNKNKILLVAVLLLWVITIVLTLFSYKDSLGYESYGNNEYEYIEKLDNKTELIQYVDSRADIVSVSIRLEVYRKTNNNVTIEVSGNNSGTIYGSRAIKIKNVLGAAYNTVGLDKPIDTKTDDKLIIRVYTDAGIDEIGVWCTFSNAFEGNRLTVGNGVKDGSTSLRLLYSSEMFSKFYKTIISIVIVVITALILYLLLFNPRKEIIYTAMVLLLGVIFMVILTPICGPDEEFHYRVSLIVSNKLLGKENVNEIEDVYIGYYSFRYFFNVGSGYRDIIENFAKSLVDLAGRRIYTLDRGYVYSYDICYYPSSILISVARLLKLNFLKTYYLGRLGNLLFYTVCTYIAIKKTPVYKNLFGIFALLPINLQQAICYSQDVWICGLSMILFAYFLNWYHKEGKIEKKEFIFVMIIDLLLAPAKIVYSLIMLLYVLIPNEKFYSKKHKYICLALLLGPMLYQIGKNIILRIYWALVAKVHAEDTGSTTTHEIDVYFSLNYIVKHPKETIAIIYRTLRVNLKSWFAGATGRYLAGMTLIIPSGTARIIPLFLLISAFFSEQYQMNNKIRILIVLICLGIGSLTLFALLTGWTDIKSEFIEGIQGRYFSPLLVYFFSIFNNKKVSIPQRFDKYLIIAELFLYFEVITYILSYTFIY